MHTISNEQITIYLIFTRCHLDTGGSLFSHLEHKLKIGVIIAREINLLN